LATEHSTELVRASAPGRGNREKRSKTAAYYTAFVALGLVGASLGPTLPGLAENTQSVLSEISFLFTAVGLGYLIGSVVGGRLYDRVRGHPVMALMILAISVTMFLVPLIPELWLLTVVVLVLGMAEGVLDVGGNTLLVWVHRASVTPFMNALHFFFGVGAFLSPIIIAQAVLFGGDIKWAYWALALVILPVAAFLLRLPSPGAIKNQAAKRHAETDRSDSRRVSDESLLILLIVVFFFVYAGAEMGFGGWVFTYALESGLLGETSAAYLTSVFFGAFTLGRLLAVPIATRARPRLMILGDLAGAIASVCAIMLCSESVTATWLGTIGLGLSLASIFPTMLSLAERRITITGRVTGWFFVGVSSGAMFWPWLIGQFFESIGPQVMIAIVLVALILATGVFTALILYSASFVRRGEAESAAI
jgi:FHS family Na+ dependent glucose MFS transporter 1